jgi:hypothetical protein
LERVLIWVPPSIGRLRCRWMRNRFRLKETYKWFPGCAHDRGWVKETRFLQSIGCTNFTKTRAS